MTTTALAPVERHELALDRPATAVEIRAQVNLLQEVMQAVMKEGVHFGIIPGTPKPTLFKPGSEKILSTFRIAIEPIVTDLSTHDEARYRVETRATSQATGMYLGSGTGEASSNEEKYRWRKAVCQEEFDATPEDRRRAVWKKGYDNKPNYQIAQVRTNHADVANTILKMAKKRSQMDVTLTVTAASDVFTQDIEDLPEDLREAVAEGEAPRQAAPTKPPVAAPQRKSQGTTTTANLAAATVRLSDVTSFQGTNDNGPWTKWSWKGSDGKKYSTFDTKTKAVVEEATEAGQSVSVTYVEDKYGRNIKTIAIADRQPGDEK